MVGHGMYSTVGLLGATAALLVLLLALSLAAASSTTEEDLEDRASKKGCLLAGLRFPDYLKFCQYDDRRGALHS